MGYNEDFGWDAQDENSFDEFGDFDYYEDSYAEDYGDDEAYDRYEFQEDAFLDSYMEGRMMGEY